MTVENVLQGIYKNNCNSEEEVTNNWTKTKKTR